MKSLILIGLATISLSSFASHQFCHEPIELKSSDKAGDVKTVILDIALQKVHLPEAIETDQGPLAKGDYPLYQDIESHINQADCDEGLAFNYGTFNEIWDREYQRTKVVMDLLCSKDSVGTFSIFRASGYCIKPELLN